MKNKIIILLSLFLLTGCTVNYNLDIDKDFNVVETLNVLVNKDDFEINYDSYKEGVDSVFDKINGELKYKLSDYKIKKRKNNINVLFKNEYISQSEFVLSSFMKNANAKIENYKKGNNDIFQILINYDFNDLINTRKYSNIPIDDMTLTIDFPYKVISSNADKTEKNKLTWDLKSLKESRSFYIEYDQNEIVKSNKINYLLLSIILALIVLMILIIIVILRKRRKDKVA